MLHSYLGGFEEEEIALIRQLFRRRNICMMLAGKCDSAPERADEGTAGEECRGRGAAGPSSAAAACEKSGAVSGAYGTFPGHGGYLSVQELLQVILRETIYLNYVAVKPEGGRRRANVEMLLVKAADYEKTSYFGLYHFLRYMEQLEKYEVDYGEAALQDENADVVRIMSVHKSKGLEFPVCFVCGLAKSFQTRDTSGHLALDIDAGIGVDYVKPDLRVCSRICAERDRRAG